MSASRPRSCTGLQHQELAYAVTAAFDEGAIDSVGGGARGPDEHVPLPARAHHRRSAPIVGDGPATAG